MQMDILIHPSKLYGTVQAIPSKSMAHRMLICGALGNQKLSLACSTGSQDIFATARCLSQMGAEIRHISGKFEITPMHPMDHPNLSCGESGSTLRFLLPVVAALGHGATFFMEGRLPQRPLTPLIREMEAHGASISRPTENTLVVSGQLAPGCYQLPGNVSSQYISGLLFALPLLKGESHIRLEGTLESAPYVDMTIGVLQDFGVSIAETSDGYTVMPSQFRSPGMLNVEGDWSNGAFWLTAAELGNSVAILGLNEHSRQGDRVICSCLSQLGDGSVIDASNIPDLIPILAVAACTRKGDTHFVNAGRLRLKESDRIYTVTNMLRGLGCSVSESADGFTVTGGSIAGGKVDSANDHRIAMAAAIAATVSKAPVILLGAEAVSKSYPHFWADYAALGGMFEEV